MLDTNLSLYTLLSRGSAFKVHATLEVAKARAAQIAGVTGRAVKVSSAEGKWLVLPGATATLEKAWRGSWTSPKDAAAETAEDIANLALILQRCEARKVRLAVEAE